MSRLRKVIGPLEHAEYSYRYRSAKASHTCLICGDQASVFTDEWGALEYEISGLCQKCQDGFFRNKQRREL
jgi:hypothetical protein